MPEPNDLAQEITRKLEDAIRKLQDLENRLLEGQQIDEQELDAISKAVAGTIEEARARLEQAVSSNEAQR